MLKTKPHFFLLWVSIVSTCIYIGIKVSLFLGEFLYEQNGMPRTGGNDGTFEGVLSLLLVVGLLMGFGQWLVINTRIKKVSGWILATWVGFSLGSFLFYFLFALLSTFAGKYYRVYDWITMAGTPLGAGMFTGVCQWISLKRSISGSLQWSLVMALSFAMGIVLVSFVSALTLEVGSILFSITIGLISGIFAEPLLLGPEVQSQETAI